MNIHETKHAHMDHIHIDIYAFTHHHQSDTCTLIHLSIHPPNHPSIHRFTHSSNRPTTYPPTHSPTYLSIHQPTHTHMHTYIHAYTQKKRDAPSGSCVSVCTMVKRLG